MILFLTRSTGIAALRDGEFSAASVAYEASLISSLKSLAEISVINIGGDSKKEARVSWNGLHYSAMGFGRLHSLIKALACIISMARSGGRPVILTTGYYPLEMIALLFLRLLGFNVYSIIYDSHASALTAMSAVKRVFVDMYFKIGFLCAGFLSGVVVVNKCLIGKFIISPRRILLSRIGALFKGVDLSLPKFELQRPPRFLFAGTLNSENGVGLLLEVFSRLPELRASLVFYGGGEAVQHVIEAAAMDPRISFGGRISDKDLDMELLLSDFLVCLRDPNSVSATYAFPSKLIKFMGSGVPVLINRFPGIDVEMEKCLLVVDRFSATELSDGICNAITMSSVSEIGSRAKHYIQENHDWGLIAKEMAEFFSI